MVLDYLDYQVVLDYLGFLVVLEDQVAHLHLDFLDCPDYLGFLDYPDSLDYLVLHHYQVLLVDLEVLKLMLPILPDYLLMIILDHSFLYHHLCLKEQHLVEHLLPCKVLFDPISSIV